MFSPDGHVRDNVINSTLNQWCRVVHVLSHSCNLNIPLESKQIQLISTLAH